MKPAVVALTWLSYQIGEVFIMCTPDDSTAMLEKHKSELTEEIAGVESKCEQHKQVLSDLKVKLYAKFGNNINLEAEED